MMPAAARALRMALDQRPTGRVRDLILLALEIEGETVPLAPPSAPASAAKSSTERWRDWNERRKRGANGTPTTDQTPTPTQTNAATNGAANALASVGLGGGGGNLVKEDQKETLLSLGPERERVGTDPTKPTRPTPNANALANGERYVRADDPLTEELRATAQMAGVQDIAGAWLKFCGHYADKWVHVQGKWQHWCVNEAKRERTERDRRPAGPRKALQPAGDWQEGKSK